MGGSAGSVEVRTATVEATEALPETVNRGAFGDERVEVEVGADFNGLRRDHDGEFVSVPLAVGVDGRRDAVQNIDPIQGAHASGDQAGRVISLFECAMRVASGSHPIHHDTDTANILVRILLGDRLDDLQHGSGNGVVVPDCDQFGFLGGGHPAAQLLALFQIGARVQHETFSLLVVGRG